MTCLEHIQQALEAVELAAGEARSNSTLENLRHAAMSLGYARACESADRSSNQKAREYITAVVDGTHPKEIEGWS